jgi:hypothetical protein
MLKTEFKSQVWWCTSVIPGGGGRRITSSRPHGEALSRNQTKAIRKSNNKNRAQNPNLLKVRYRLG